MSVARLRTALEKHQKKVGGKVWPDAVFLPADLFYELCSDPDGIYETIEGPRTHGMQAERTPGKRILFAYLEPE